MDILSTFNDIANVIMMFRYIEIRKYFMAILLKISL